VVGQPLADVLNLERLSEIAADGERLLARLFDALEGFVGLDDPGHFGLDLRKVLLGQRVRQVKVVVEPVLDRGTKRELHSGKEPHHCPGHDVCARVPHFGQRGGVAVDFGVLLGQQAERDLALGRQRLVGVGGLAVDQCGKGGLGQARTDRGRDFARRHWLSEILAAAIWQANGKHCRDKPLGAGYGLDEGSSSTSGTRLCLRRLARLPHPCRVSILWLGSGMNSALDHSCRQVLTYLAALPVA
jgi:hypothetical protein